jgi:hypothetical protein
MVCVMALQLGRAFSVLQLGRAFSVLTPIGCSLYKGHANTSARGADSVVALSM